MWYSSDSGNVLLQLHVLPGPDTFRKDNRVLKRSKVSLQHLKFSQALAREKTKKYTSEHSFNSVHASEVGQIM